MSMDGRNASRVLILSLGFLWTTAVSAQAPGEWHHYGQNKGSSKYIGLDQITPKNFGDLEVAWRWRSVDGELAGVTDFEPGHLRATPLMIGGRVFLPTGLSQVAALDAETGEQLWVYDTRAYSRGVITHGMFQHRGLEYWTDGKAERLLIATAARELVSVDAATGKPDPKFGDNGHVDLMKDLGREANIRNIANSAPVIVVGDTIIVGSIIMDFPTRNSNPPGHIRAYDVRTGEFKWRFHSIPQEGEPYTETWENESWKVAGNTNVWSMMSGDDELGYVYLPFGTPTSDYYGGHRLGDNVYAESLVCLKADTGEYVWHFQAVHHGIWDYDFPAAPNLIDITVDGRQIKAVAQVSKQGFTYVFDRATGEPVWPIVERPVNDQTKVPGERLSPTQPFPTKPPPFEPQGFDESRLIDLTPELLAEAKKVMALYETGPLFTPTIVENTDGKKATIVSPGAAGGANWPGASIDPESGMLFVQSQADPSGMALTKPDPARSDFNYTIAFQPIDEVQGLPLIKPPWRRLTAIDLNRGEIAWTVPFGEGPKDHPALASVRDSLPDLGTRFPGRVLAEGGILVTRTLLVSFLPILDELGDRIPTGARLLAIDKASGKILAEVEVDRSLHGSPMSYSYKGRQFILVAGGGREEPGELVAFALPVAD